MSRTLLSAIACGVLLAAVSAGGPAEAAVRWGKCGAPTRVSGKGVVCANGFTYNFNAGGPGETWVAKLTTPMNQCAPLRFTLELDGKKLKSTAALAAGKSETVTLGNALAAGAHVLVVKTQFMFSDCYPENPPQTPGNWGVDTLISLQPK